MKFKEMKVKVSDWMCDHEELVIKGMIYFTAAWSFVCGSIVGSKLAQNRMETGLRAMCCTDPTLIDHIKDAGTKTFETLSKCQNISK